MAAEVGQQAPDFELFDNDKNPTKLSDSKGKNVVLAFFPGAFTGVSVSYTHLTLPTIYSV